MTVLDPQTFAAGNLADSEGLTAALRMLESCLAGPDIPLDLIVQDLCSVPNLFEFIISASTSGRKLVSGILDTYPTEPSLVEPSSASRLLQRLSSFIFALPPDLFPTGTIRQIGQGKVYVEDALPVLALLCSTEFSAGFTCTDATPKSVLEDPEHDSEEFSGFLVRNKKQKKSRRKTVNTNTVDLTFFHKLGAKVPLNNSEASQLACEITDKLKKILKLCLELLLEPFLAKQLKDAYISTGNSTTAHPAVPQQRIVREAVESKQSAYPKVQPMKAALYFENADGFGEWRIIISTDAIKKLRELSGSDRKKCAIVVKKIKQLSNGHFSDENQKRLNGSSGVPIFEAKMQRDLRLVYQIDVVSDHDGEVERQVIKIYGIYTHTQLNRIWGAIGQHLAGKGKEYSRRCIYRNRPVCAGGDVYLPACFPPENLENDTRPTRLVLSDEDMGELHSLLVLEKYVTFSQAFFHSLIANQDVQHVFELTSHERKIVECKTSCYVLGRSGTGKTTTMLFKMLGIQRAWLMQLSGDGMPKPRQIFVTKSRVLATKVEEYFTKLLESLALAGYSLEDLKRIQTRNTESGLVDPDDIERVDIPQRYSLLEENHFPLFVTFDKLARMIAADILSGDGPEVQCATKLFINTDENEAAAFFVTYDVFSRTYWPHFPQPLTKGLEPWLVFSEFMGIIKGSEKSLACPDGFLDEATYCGLPARSNPTFVNHRKTLYALFEAYCKLKKERRHHDIADRTHAILRTLLSGTPFKGQRVDYLYIDEAQDNLLIDALLLRLICRNSEGLFWAGDTAQTISAGSSFRFDDLKAFLYRIEQELSTHVIRDRSITDPTVFQLAINYRSHGGIVNCAHSVIERIMHFWPDAIDSLRPEHGIVDGLKPVFFRGWDQDTVRYEQFLFGKSGSRIEFGAQQCILVRDDKAVEKLRKEVGEVGLIMTLYDSKGLEFNDVLLYNFFEDSAIDVSRWRVLLNHAEGEVDGKELTKVPAPSFGRDDGRFAGLKLLYVGITRARKNLWIFDKSDKSEPMRMIWTSRHQVQNCTPGTDVPHLAVSSTPAEWESFGHDLFKHKRYPQAMHCFARASLPRMVAICEAFYLREVARAKVDIATKKAQQDAFLTAARAFTTSGNDAPPGKDKLQYYRNAAECYVRADDDRKAAIRYLSAQEYDLAARRFRKAGLFNDTLEVLHKYAQKIPSESSEELYTVCRLYYCSKRDGNRPDLPLFTSFEEEQEFLESYDLDFARAALLESHKKYLEAAELHLTENRPLDAIRDLLKERGSHIATQKATKIILDGLWHRCSFGISPKEVAADRDVADLLNFAHNLSIDFLDPLDHDEISMFRAIAQADLTSLEKLANVFIKGNRKAAALLALDHFFSRLPVLRSYKVHEMSLFLVKFLEYVRLLHSVISHPDPLSASSIRQLFCIREISNSEYGLELGSFLHSSATGDRDGLMYRQNSVIALSKNDVVSALRKYLARHLCERVTKENDLCCEALVFSQCLTFIINDLCNRVNCPQDHVKLADLDSKRYNVRISIHLQQIRVLQLMYSVNDNLQLPRRSTVLVWLTHLYEAFNPQFHVQGSIADFDLSLIPDAHEGMRVMKHWVWDALYALHPGRLDFLTTVLKLTSLLFTFDQSNALKCINQAYINARHIRIPEFIYSDGRYVVEDIVSHFDGTQQSCISSGMIFLKHVLGSSQVVDLSVFCDCLEEVVGKISVAWRLFFDPPLDGLVLPRGWLSSNKDFSRKKDVRIPLALALLDYVQELLMRLQSDTATHIYMLSHTKLTPILCNVFISRICRALCFLIHNVRNPALGRKVKNIFNTLRTAGPMQRAHPLYRKYVQARDGEYLKAIVEYDLEARVVIEDLVQLLHESRNPRAPLLKLARIKHIYFATPSDIPSLLASSLVVARSDLRATAQAFVPHAGYVSQTERAEDEEKIQPEAPDTEPVDEAHEEHQELAPAPNEPALIREHEPSEQEISAVKKIQATYRTYRIHRDAQARAMGRGLRAQRNTIFIACLRNVYASGWRRTAYRTLYLWALPRLMVCLDKAIAIAHECKSRTKGLLLKEGHERLEELGKQANGLYTLLKEAHNLRKEIEPNATMHQAKGRDHTAMRQAVLYVKCIIHRLPVEVPEIENDLRFAYDLVMAEKQQVMRPEKPSLNTEDLDF